MIWVTRLSLTLNVVLCAVLLAPMLTPAATASFSESVPPGLATRMSANDAAEIALALMKKMETNRVGTGPTKPTRIISVMAATGPEVGSIEPRAGGTAADNSVVWVVRGEGTFIAARGRTTEIRLFSSGYIIIDDATGDILGMGMP